MNGKKAKALRKKVYGDQSHRQREYKDTFYREWNGTKRLALRVNKPGSLRQLYQASKKG